MWLPVSMDSHSNSCLTKRQAFFSPSLEILWKGCYWPDYDYVQPMAREVGGQLLAHCSLYFNAYHLTNEVCFQIK